MGRVRNEGASGRGEAVEAAMVLASTAAERAICGTSLESSRQRSMILTVR